jgi:adenylosuccinate synthase
MSLWVVVGGQFGSEGKGKISAFIAKTEGIDICVRCGGPNSGHSFVDERGQTIILRQLPTGFINKGSRLLIPAGGLIDPMVLKHEIEFLGIPSRRVGIDPNCFVIDERDRNEEQRVLLQERLSSTLCGVGSAVSRRALRGDDARLVKDVLGEHRWLRELVITKGVSEEVNAALDLGKRVLIEGTQGVGLSVYHSQYYPHCTSRDTTAAGFLSEVGVSPRLVTEIVVVFRTFPIRVAGRQAGPFGPSSEEITWEQLQSESGYPYSIQERTTVTNKVRRVARFDWELARMATLINRPTRLAINGLDYLDYKNRGVPSFQSLTPDACDFVRRLQTQSSCEVSYCGTGPQLDEILSDVTEARASDRVSTATSSN